MTKKYTIKNCIDTALARGGNCLSIAYHNCKEKMQWICVSGHIWEAMFDSINRGSWCPHCAPDKIKQTNLDKYGVDNPAKVPEIQDKIKQTNLERYGSECATKSDAVKNKTKNTNIERYGATTPLIQNEIRKQTEQLFLSRYGAKTPLGNKQQQESNRQKMLQKHGVDNPAKVPEIQEKIKQTNLERYGCHHVSQCPDIALKIARKTNIPSIKIHWKTGEELICQGSWEAKTVDYLNNNKVEYLWQPEIFKLSDGKTYRPDLFLVNENKWVEIKGYFRDKAKKKWDEFVISHPNSEIWDKNRLKELNIL
jgi:hypothetical protein